MKVNLTNHCIEQIAIRKQKEKKAAIFFWIYVFAEMMRTMEFKWTPCKIRKSYWWAEIISHKETWYKFVYVRENPICFTLITFAIHSKLDFEIGKLIRKLCKEDKKTIWSPQKRGSIIF